RREEGERGSALAHRDDGWSDARQHREESRGDRPDKEQATHASPNRIRLRLDSLLAQADDMIGVEISVGLEHMQKLRLVGARLRRLHPELVWPDPADITVGISGQRVLVVVQPNDDEASLRVGWIEGGELMDD